LQVRDLVRCEKVRCDRGVLEDVRIDIKGGRFLNKLAESSSSVLLNVAIPVKLTKFSLKGRPVRSNVTREQLNDVFDRRSAIVRKTGTFVGVSIAVIVAFKVPVLDKLGDVVSVEEKSTGLSRARHNCTSSEGNYRRICSGGTRIRTSCRGHVELVDTIGEQGYNKR